MNCHYVTRSLTKPWEDHKRILHYFDFETDQIDCGFSESLLAKEDILSKEEELFFSKYIETHIGIFKKDLLTNGTADVNKWPVYRALMLFFTFQTERYSKFLGKDQNDKSLFDLTETELDHVASIFFKKYDLAYVVLKGENFSCFPSAGIFQIPIQDTFCLTNWQFSFGFPIVPNVIVFLHSKTMVKSYLPLLQKNIHRYSVGLNDGCTKVVFPSDLLSKNSPDTIKEYIKGTRKLMIEETEQIHKLRDLVHKMYEQAGLGFKIVSALEVV